MILWYKELPLYKLDRCQFLFSFSEKRENSIWGNQWVKQAENTPLLLKKVYPTEDSRLEATLWKYALYLKVCAMIILSVVD